MLNETILMMNPDTGIDEYLPTCLTYTKYISAWIASRQTANSFRAANPKTLALLCLGHSTYGYTLTPHISMNYAYP